MGHIAEPKNLDLIIESPPLSEQERKEISKYIEKLKKKRNIKSKARKRKEKSRTLDS